MQTLRVNNSRILTIKNAEFSGYYFLTNLNIWEDFQICISVLLRTPPIQNTSRWLFRSPPEYRILIDEGKSIFDNCKAIWRLSISTLRLSSMFIYDHAKSMLSNSPIMKEGSFLVLVAFLIRDKALTGCRFFFVWVGSNN